MFLKNNFNRKFINLMILIFIISIFFIAVSAVVAKTINVLTSSDDVANFRSKIGIGTSAPNRNLHIYDIGANAEIDLQSVSGVNNHWAIYHNSADNTLRFWNNNIADEKNIFTIDSRGNVGIGKTNPAYKLDVNGSINASAGYYWNGYAGISNTYSNIVPTNYNISNTYSNIVPTNYNIWSIWTSISGVNTASSPTTITVRNSSSQLCYMYFTSGILTSSTCP